MGKIEKIKLSGETSAGLRTETVLSLERLARKINEIIEELNKRGRDK